MKNYPKHLFRDLKDMIPSVSNCRGYHKMTIILVCLLLQTMNMYAQNNVSGIVKDSEGETLIGVSILVKQGEKQAGGTITNAEGFYQIKTTPDATLEFSCIGYKTQKISVNGREKINVVLEADNQLLDEVVVVGFATQKKVNLTGSVSTVGSKELASMPVRNTVLALQGQVPGLTIKQQSGQLYGKNPSMQLRGLTTIGQGSSGEMLVLIDGMEGDPYSINPQDIENISVLKDAAASSIYGSRAPFGVILITTKKGKAGKASVNYNNNFRFND